MIIEKDVENHVQLTSEKSSMITHIHKSVNCKKNSSIFLQYSEFVLQSLLLYDDYWMYAYIYISSRVTT